MRFEFTDAIGQVSLGPHRLPGVYQRISIGIELELDQHKVKGRSGNAKVPKGFNDAEVTLELRLVPDETGASPYDQLEQMRRLFYGPHHKPRPTPYPFVHAAARAMGIRQVLFVKLDVDDASGIDGLVVKLRFVGHEPIVRKREKAQLRRKVVELGAAGGVGLIPLPSGAGNAKVNQLVADRIERYLDSQKLLSDVLSPAAPGEGVLPPKPTEPVVVDGWKPGVGRGPVEFPRGVQLTSPFGDGDKP